MTADLVPPRITEQMSQSKERIDALERRLNLGYRDPLPYIAKFSLWGELTETVSGIEQHPFGGRLVLVYANLDTAGTTVTTVDILKNAQLLDRLSMPAGVTHAEVRMEVGFSALGDTLQMGIDTAGADAETITVFGIFDR